ncbi:BCD family MFS transporter [Roseospirillum parvum]|uniref:MFS transporter, BCD family, chlorophyll transporter n=1 Tax=Roseospirillum parvum TaxID=83401 RepID=A0A1G7WC39_9PROT|nr:BCD family MFS transporter [Roseospirillum parvum]SDG69536.1 MFS transporter, BCD family, chlorophyll transporter [Roseospirillum parvum]
MSRLSEAVEQVKEGLARLVPEVEKLAANLKPALERLGEQVRQIMVRLAKARAEARQQAAERAARRDESGEAPGGADRPAAQGPPGEGALGRGLRGFANAVNKAGDIDNTITPAIAALTRPLRQGAKQASDRLSGADKMSPAEKAARQAQAQANREKWGELINRNLPFADAATDELPMKRLLRLALFQVSVGMAMVLLTGTLNRVMIVELDVPAWLVATMVALPIVFAPFRVLIGFKSDTHKSVLGWKRVPYIWFGTLLQFGGLAIMPFALLVLSGQTEMESPEIIGRAAAGLAFLLVGAGLHTTQTAGLALATDLAPEDTRPRVVALLYVFLLVGQILAGIVFAGALLDFSHFRLIQVIQGAAVITLVFNTIALWKQEARNPQATDPEAPRPSFRETWAEFMEQGRPARLLVVTGLGTAGFTMQDILLEPYGGEILGMSVGSTTFLTALLAAGSLAGFALAGKGLSKGFDPHRLAAFGVLAGIIAFTAVLFAAPLGSEGLFRVGTVLIGFGAGLFAVGTMTAAMALATEGGSGLALGAWGAVQATAMGFAIAVGGGLKDVLGSLAENGLLGEALETPYTGYGLVYSLEVVLLFATLVVVGPMVRYGGGDRRGPPPRFGLAEFPG